MLRFRIGLRLALGRDPRLLNHFYRFYYGPAAMRLSQHFKEIERLFFITLLLWGQDSLKFLAKQAMTIYRREIVYGLAHRIEPIRLQRGHIFKPDPPFPEGPHSRRSLS
jgi:hypothetical protein